VISVDCFVGRFRSGLPDPGIDLPTLGRVIADGFGFASRGSDGNDNIRIGFNANRADVPVAGMNLPTDTLRLQQALQLLINQQPDPTQPRRIGLLLADVFAERPSVFGLMFDQDFVGTSPPREGCAIFLQAIQQRRAAEGAEAFTREVRFTAIHELGHVFNLWHLPSPASFMASSGPTAFPVSAHVFDASHLRYLQNSAESDREFIAPAGRPFGERAPGFPQGAEPFANQNAPKAVHNGSLRIRGPEQPVFHFEPFELEIQLSSLGKRRAQVPDELDPGHGAFAIWIEEPTGERRRYRPVKHFLQTRAVRTIEQRRPFVRDISLFGEAGGYAFRAPGTHRVWVTFRISAKRLLRSNTIEIEVRDPRGGNAGIRQLRAALTRPAVASFLYYRDGPLSPADGEAIATVITRQKKSLAAGGLHYALGRGIATRVLHEPAVHEAAVPRAREHLLRAIDSNFLNGHRRAKAGKIVEQLSQL
jgi:hypothetical protein